MTLRANHLTVLRVLLLPLPYFLLYQGIWGRVAALLIFTALGLTDYLDGLLARRHGATRLGKLLDPIADKIFLVVIVVCLIDLDILPFWLAIPIFLRESLVAEIRRTGIQLEVTELAKIKTTIQMAASGLMFLLDTFKSKIVLVAFLSGAELATIFLAVALFIRDGRLSSRMHWAIGLLGLALVLGMTLPQRAIYLTYGSAVVIITLVSGGVYFVKGIPALFSKGRVCILKALLTCIFPILPLWLIQDLSHNGLWAIILILSMEYAAQGLDAIITPFRKDLSLFKSLFIIPLAMVLLTSAKIGLPFPGLDVHLALILTVSLYAFYLILDLIYNKDVVFLY